MIPTLILLKIYVIIIVSVIHCKCKLLSAQSLQLDPALCDSMDCSPPGSSVRGIIQVRILEWGGLPCSPPENLPAQGLNPSSASPALQADSLPTDSEINTCSKIT